METYRLVAHPAGAATAAESLACEAWLEEGRATFIFRLGGRISDIVIPDLVTAARSDGLWRSTCFEMFVRHSGARGYREFNWSPSMRWAGYSFDDYRLGMTDLANAEPATASGSNDGEYWIAATVDLAALPPPPWRIGLSAVIEETDGTKSYWALRHPPGKPDFHHPDCFALELTAPEAP